MISTGRSIGQQTGVFEDKNQDSIAKEEYVVSVSGVVVAEEFHGELREKGRKQGGVGKQDTKQRECEQNFNGLFRTIDLAEWTENWVVLLLVVIHVFYSEKDRSMYQMGWSEESIYVGRMKM